MVTPVSFEVKETDLMGRVGVMSGARSYLVLGLICVLSFLAVTALVFSDATQGADAQLAVAINHADLGSVVTSILVDFSQYGREYFWIPVVGVMLVAGNRRTKLLAVELAALFVVGIALGEAMKLLVFRARPFESIDTIITRVPTDLDSSFPSGHALIVSIGAAFSMLKFRRRAVASLLALEAAIVCYSRVFVGMHYPLDVVAGVLLGMGIVGVGLFLIETYLAGPMTRVASLVTDRLRDGPLDL